MSRNNWNWEKYPMTLINWKIKPEYVADKKAEIEFMLAREQKISISLTRDLAELVKMGIDVHVNAKLTITQHENEEVTMDGQGGFKNHNGDNAIDKDDVTNSAKAINKEYSITVDQVSGKIHIANDLDGSEAIIQGIIQGYLAKPKNGIGPAGAFFDNTVPQKEGDLKRALFSGMVYFENLPVDLMGDAVTAEQADPKQLELEMEYSEAEKRDKEANEKKQAKSKQEVCPELPSEEMLRLLPKGQLKPPRGTSRTIRNEWWSKLRNLYTECFDVGGNWIGFPDISSTSDSDDSSVLPAKSTIQKPKKAVAVDESSKDIIPGLLKAVGEGNRMTNMADKNIRKGFILGVLVRGKGYSTLSTPTAVGDEQGSALVVCNKPRTGKFMLAGLLRNTSFMKKVQGYDLVDVMTFHKKYFTEDSLVYFVTNAVTALTELGTQEKDIVDIKENSA